MNFSDLYKNFTDDFDGEVEDKAIDPEPVRTPEELLTKMAHYDVTKFLAMDKELREAGFEDKDERLRIIDIIF